MRMAGAGIWVGGRREDNGCCLHAKGTCLEVLQSLLVCLQKTSHSELMQHSKSAQLLHLVQGFYFHKVITGTSLETSWDNIILCNVSRFSSGFFCRASFLVHYLFVRENSLLPCNLQSRPAKSLSHSSSIPLWKKGRTFACYYLFIVYLFPFNFLGSQLEHCSEIQSSGESFRNQTGFGLVFVLLL